MPHYPHTATAPLPRVFNYSLDWRFLLPLADLRKMGLLFEEEADFGQTLERVDIHASQKLSLSDLRNHKTDNFHILVMPFGLPIGWAGTRYEERVEFYVSVRRCIDSGGFLLVGFNNALNRGANSKRNYYSSTPRSMAGQLKQAGFHSVKIYGAMPNLLIPEYIFDLDSRTIQFALQNRFRRKSAVLRVLNALAGMISWKRMSNFLPCYFVIGIA